MVGESASITTFVAMSVSVRECGRRGAGADRFRIPHSAFGRRAAPASPHASMYMTFFTAAIVFAASGFAARSRFFA
jgi:hypothetical protein